MKADFYIDAHKILLAAARACLSNRQLAAKADLAPETITRLIRKSSGGIVGVTGVTAGKLARALNVDVLDLLAEPEAKQA